MPDFREKINTLQQTNTKNELIDALEERFGKRTTSVNPLTEAMFDHIAPDHHPHEYAQKSEDYSAEMSRVAKNATALKILLHEQVSRPLYEPVETLVKQDFAECIAAVDAYEEGHERGIGKHVPTTLPQEVVGFVDEPPDRSLTPESPFEIITDLDNGYKDQILQWLDQHFDGSSSSHFIYVLDCTPGVGTEEPSKLWDRRRAVQTKIEADIPLPDLKPKERATHALNQSKRVYYVGSTSDVSKRVHEHVIGTDKSGVNFTNTLPPQSLVKVEGCDSKERAVSLEGALARELNRKENLFAYSDEM